MLKAVGEITLTVVNDGENGTSPFFVSVGNESQNIPCDNNGLVLENMLITIPFGGYSGINRVECNVTVDSMPAGITLGENTPSSTTDDGAIVLNVEKGSSLGGSQVLSGEINLSFEINDTILKRKFTWAKTKDGDSACLYQLSPSSLIIKKGADNKLSPSSILFSSTVLIGNSTEKNPYAGRFIIEESTDGGTYKSMYVSASDESEKDYTPSNSDIKIIKCTLCSAGSLTNVLDTQSVIVLTDIDNIDDALSEIRTEISSVSLKVDKNEKAINEEVWRDTMIKIVDSDGKVVERTLENLIVQHNVNLNGIETKVQDVTTKYENEIPSLKEDVSTVKQNQSAFEVTVSQTYETKENAEQSYTAIKEDAKKITLEAADKRYANQSDSVKKVEVFYYLSSSSSSLLDGEWVYPAPEWKNEYYMWSKQKTTLVDGTTSETAPTCIAGATGQNGKDGIAGRSVSSIKPQYYSSTSKVTVPKDAVWSYTQPDWKSGNYLWTRTEITYINSDKTTSVEYTNPICDTTWEAVDVAKAALEVNINEVKQEVTDARGTDASIAVRLGKIDSKVSDAEGNITEAIQTATEAKQVAEDAQGNITEVVRRSNELESTVSKKLIGIRYIRDWLSTNTSSDVSEKRWSKCHIISDDTNIAENILPYSYSLNETPTISNQASAKNNGIINKSFYTSSDNTEATDYISLNNGTWDALQIDLGSEKKVDYITVWHYFAETCKYNHKLMVSLDNKKWTVLYDSNVSGSYVEDPDGKTYILNDGYSTSKFSSNKQTIDNISTIVSSHTDAIQNFDVIEKSLQDSIDDNYENISNIKDSLADTNSDLSDLKQSYSQTTNTVNSIKDTVASIDSIYAKKSEVELSDNEWKVRLAKIGLYDGDDIEHIETNFTVSEAGAVLNNNKGQSVSLELNGESGTGLYGRYNNEIILQVTKDLTITKRLQSENGIDCMTIKLVPSSYGNVGALLHVKSGGTS